jgi:hypothetical protein
LQKKVMPIKSGMTDWEGDLMLGFTTTNGQWAISSSTSRIGR